MLQFSSFSINAGSDAAFSCRGSKTGSMQFVADISHHTTSSLSQLTCTNSLHRQKVYQFVHNFNLSSALCQDAYYVIPSIPTYKNWWEIYVINISTQEKRDGLGKITSLFSYGEIPLAIVNQSPLTLVINYNIILQYFDILQQIVAFLFI